MQFELSDRQFNQLLQKINAHSSLPEKYTEVNHNSSIEQSRIANYRMQVQNGKLKQQMGRLRKILQAKEKNKKQRGGVEKEVDYMESKLAQKLTRNAELGVELSKIRGEFSYSKPSDSRKSHRKQKSVVKNQAHQIYLNVSDSQNVDPKPRNPIVINNPVKIQTKSYQLQTQKIQNPQKLNKIAHIERLKQIIQTQKQMIDSYKNTGKIKKIQKDKISNNVIRPCGSVGSFIKISRGPK